MNENETLTHTIRQHIFASVEEPFDITEAQVFAYTSNASIRVLVEHNDPYQALWAAAFANLKEDEDGIGIITVGWAAPLAKVMGDFDGPPSQHPAKRRVRLFCYCNAQGDVSSSIRFKDDDEVTYDENQATGSLKEAMTAMFKDKKDATKAFKAFQN